MEWLQVGELRILPLSDGEANLPAQYFANADWSVHQDLLGPEGTLKIPIGCFLVQTRGLNVLIDAGLGPVTSPFMSGGALPSQLETAGLAPADINVVLCTHLHIDHIGWIAREGVPYFPNATVTFGAGDWDHFVTKGDPGDFARQNMEMLAALGRIEVIDGDKEVAPGVSTLHAPGHTPGHLCVVVSSKEERVVLLGDAVTCPVQLEEPEWQAISDVDPALAGRTRETLWRELESSGDLTVAAHFPELRFGRVLQGEGKRYFG